MNMNINDYKEQALEAKIEKLLDREYELTTSIYGMGCNSKGEIEITNKSIFVDRYVLTDKGSFDKDVKSIQLMNKLIPETTRVDDKEVEEYMTDMLEYSNIEDTMGNELEDHYFYLVRQGY